MIQIVSISFTADLSKTYLTLKSQQMLKNRYFLALALSLLKIGVVTPYSSQIGTLNRVFFNDACLTRRFVLLLLSQVNK